MKKKTLLTIIILTFPILALAQTLNIHKNDGTVSPVEISDIDSITFTTYGTPCPDIPTVTYAGKAYNTVQIEDQCWLKQNLDVGEMIQGVAMTANGILEKYCYDNDTNNCERYGGLYQWDEAMQYSTSERVQGICPNGWHIPTILELQTLGNAVGGKANSLKAVGEGTGDGAGTNTSGFTGLLAGAGSSNSFGDLHIYGNFWSSTEANFINTNFLGLSNDGGGIFFSTWDKGAGFSIRCLKD